MEQNQTKTKIKTFYLKFYSIIKIFVLLILFLLTSCEKKYDKVIDPIQNKPPIISNLIAPDTLNLSTDTLKIIISIRAIDYDGKEDIQSVFFNSYLPDGSPSRSNPILMYDDGNLIVNGDQIANDGIYSRIIILPPNTTKGKYRFEFQAIDKKNARSNIINHFIVVK